jgi:mono/diheme cytochrome c family protein
MYLSRPGVGLSMAAVVFIGTPARAGSTKEAGRDMYVRYCGACHGPAGKGDGIAGTFIRPKPADLTQIAKKNGGQFPTEKVAETIDGRNTPRVHGDPDMPVWGEIFQEQAGWDASRRARVRAQILAITAYLGSIQEK